MSSSPDASLLAIKRLRLIGSVAGLAAILALASAWAPWFNASTSRGVSGTSAADSVCGAKGGMVVLDAQGNQRCVVMSKSVSGREMVGQFEDVRADGVSRNVVFQKLPASVASLPASTFWALLAGLLVLVACALQSMLAAASAPLAALAAWHALNQLASYATDPAHGGHLVALEYGASVSRWCIIVISALSVSGLAQLVVVRKEVWAARKASGLPASALAGALQGAVSKAVTQAAQSAPK